MSNERELLEFAAKACGIMPRGMATGSSASAWNPKDNSADCAAMCANLKIDTLWTDDCVICGDDSRTYESEVPLDDDPEAAWRFAACKVAEAIGRAMK